MEVIFDIQNDGRSVKKVVRHYGSYIILLDSGDVIQRVEYGDGWRMPPDMRGRRVVDICCSDPSGMGRNDTALLLDDGSKIVSGDNVEWMQQHGYIPVSCSKDICITPRGEVYRWNSTISPRSGGSQTSRDWYFCGNVDPSRVGRCVVLNNHSRLGVENVYCLTKDGAIEPLIPSQNNPLIPAPWADEGWRFIDIISTSSTIHAITTDGQVVSPFIRAGGELVEGVVWPLPDSDAESFLQDANMIAVRRRNGQVVVYPSVYKGWKGSFRNFYGGKNVNVDECIPYPTLIVGKKRGEWHDLAGTMVAMGDKLGIKRYTPSNLLTRSSIKVMKSLGGI